VFFVHFSVPLTIRIVLAGLSILAVLSVLSAIWFSYWNWPLKTLPKVLVLVSLSLCVLSCVLRMLYFAIDPFGWNNITDLCAINTLGYTSLGCVGAAYLLLVFQWITIAYASVLNRPRFLPNTVAVLRVMIVIAVGKCVCLFVLFLIESM
jgi:hypothetical protein